MLLGDSVQYKSKYCIAYFGNNKAKWYSTSNNTLLFCFIFVNKHGVLACDSLLTIETSKQEGNWHGRARGLRLLRWGIFLLVYLGDEWEGLKWLFSTLCLGRVMKAVFFKLAFVLHMLNALSFCLSYFFPILVTSWWHELIHFYQRSCSRTYGII